MSVLLTFKTDHWKYKVYNTAALLMITDSLSVYCFTAYAHSVLLLWWQCPAPCWMHDLTCRHMPLLDLPVNDLVVKLLPLFNQTCLEVIDITNACVIYTRCFSLSCNLTMTNYSFKCLVHCPEQSTSYADFTTVQATTRLWFTVAVGWILVSSLFTGDRDQFC